MEPIIENARLVKRAYWLIRLRWVAAVSVMAATYVAGNILNIVLHKLALYGVAVLLTLYNLAAWLLLNHFSGANKQGACAAVKKIIHFQICADLLILTVLLHFSGGIENPFVFFFVFHMIIGSILLSVRESYLLATLAVLLFGLLVFLEYLGILTHYCLYGFVTECSRADSRYVIGTFFVFAVTVYLVVYMASYIAVRLRRAEQAYRQTNTQLQEADRIKDEYVLRVTHDIKGHLATIQSCLSVIAGRTVGRLNEQQTDFVRRAHNRTRTLLTFVKTLLRLTRMRLGGELEMDNFSLKDIVTDAVNGVRPRAQEKPINLSYSIKPDVEQIFGNRFSIEEVIVNLLLNAVKYTPRNGTVAVNVKAEDDHALVEITDTGIGIPEDEVDRVFDECFRASNARKVEKDGTGLGLSIAKHIVESHRGRICVESEEGCGTKFTILLPRKRRP